MDCVSIPCAACVAITGLFDGHVIENELSVFVCETDGGPVTVLLVEGQSMTVTVDSEAGGLCSAVSIACVIIKCSICNKLDNNIACANCRDCFSESCIAKSIDVCNGINNLEVVAVCYCGIFLRNEVGLSTLSCIVLRIKLVERTAVDGNGCGTVLIVSIPTIDGKLVSTVIFGSFEVTAIDCNATLSYLCDRCIAVEVTIIDNYVTCRAGLLAYVECIAVRRTCVNSTAVDGKSCTISNNECIYVVTFFGLYCINSNAREIENSILGDNHGLIENDGIACLRCCICICEGGITDVADLSNEGYGSKNGFATYNNGNVVVSIGVVALLVVPKAIAGNVTGTEAGSGGSCIDSEIDTCGEAGIHFDRCLAVNGSGSDEVTIGDSYIIEEILIFRVDKYRLTIRVECTAVEFNVLCTVGPYVVGITGNVELTVVEGLAVSVEEYGTVEGTVVVDHIATVCKTVIRPTVSSPVEGYIVEGDACTVHTNVVLAAVELNTVNSTGNGDALAGRNAVSSCNENLNLVAVLCSCECFCKSLVTGVADHSNVADKNDLAVLNYSIKLIVVDGFNNAAVLNRSIDSSASTSHHTGCINNDRTLIGKSAGDLHRTAVDIQSTLSGNQEGLGGLEGRTGVYVHNADSLVAETHAVMIVNNYLGIVVQGNCRSCIFTAFGFGCGTAANTESALHGQRGVVKGHITLVNQVSQIDIRVNDLNRTVCLGSRSCLSAGYVDAVIATCGGRQISILEDQFCVCCGCTVVGTSDKQEALFPINFCSAGNGYGLAGNITVHSDGSIAFSPDQSDGITIRCSCKSSRERCVEGITNLSNLLCGSVSSGCCVVGNKVTVSGFNIGSTAGNGYCCISRDNNSSLVIDIREIKLFNVDIDYAGCLVIISKCLVNIGIVQTVILYRAVLEVVTESTVVRRGCLKVAGFRDNRTAYNKIAVVVDICTAIEVALAITNGKLLFATTQASSHECPGLESTARNQTVSSNITLCGNTFIEGTALDDQLCSVQNKTAVEGTAVNLEGRTLTRCTSNTYKATSVRATPAEGVGRAIEHTTIDSDNGTVIISSSALRIVVINNSIATSVDTTGIGRISVDGQCIAFRAASTIGHDLDSVLAICRCHSISTKIQDMMLGRLESNNVRQSNICKQSQSCAVSPCNDCLVDVIVLGRTDHSNLLGRDLIFAVSSRFKLVAFSDPFSRNFSAESTAGDRDGSVVFIALLNGKYIKCTASNCYCSSITGVKAGGEVTAVDNELALDRAQIAANGVAAKRIASIGIQSQLTAYGYAKAHAHEHLRSYNHIAHTGQGKFAINSNGCALHSGRQGQIVAVQVDRNNLAGLNGQAGNRNISQQLNSLTVCSCDCVCEIEVNRFVNLCYCIGRGNFFSVYSCSYIGDSDIGYGACFTVAGDIAHAVVTIGSDFYVRSRNIFKLVAILKETCNSTCCAVCRPNVNTGNRGIGNRCSAFTGITDDTTCTPISCTNVATVVCVYITFIDVRISVAYDAAHITATNNVNIAGNSNAGNNGVATCVRDNTAHIVTMTGGPVVSDVCGNIYVIELNVLNCRSAILSIATNASKEAEMAAVCINIKVGNGMSVTVKCTKECHMVANGVGTDRCPIDSLKINMCGELYILILVLIASVLRVCINAISEPNQFFKRGDEVRISLCTCTLKADDFLIDACLIKAGVFQNDLNLYAGSAGHLVVSIVLGSTDSHPETVGVLGIHSVGACDSDLNIFSRSIASYYRNKCFDLTGFNGDSSICGCRINTDAVTNIACLDRAILNGSRSYTAERNTALGVFNGQTVDCNTLTAGVLHKGMQSGTGGVLNDNGSGMNSADCNRASISVTCEGTTFNQECGIIVLTGGAALILDGITGVNKVNVLDGHILTNVDLDCTGKCLAGTIYCYRNIGLVDHHGLAAVSKERDNVAILCFGNCLCESLVVFCTDCTDDLNSGSNYLVSAVLVLNNDIINVGNVYDNLGSLGSGDGCTESGQSNSTVIGNVTKSGNRAAYIQLSISCDSGVLADIQLSTRRNVCNTSLVEDEVRAADRAVVTLSLVISAVYDIQSTGSGSSVIARNLSVESENVGSIKGSSTVDDKVACVEGVITVVVPLLGISIALNVQLAVVGNVEITEVSDRILDVKNILSIGHSRSLLGIGIIESGSDPAGISRTGRTDNSILNVYNNTVYGINVSVNTIVSTDTDLEESVVDYGAVNVICTACEANLRTVKLGISVKRYAVHIYPTCAGNGSCDIGSTGNVDSTVVSKSCLAVFGAACNVECRAVYIYSTTCADVSGLTVAGIDVHSSAVLNIKNSSLTVNHTNVNAVFIGIVAVVCTALGVYLTDGEGGAVYDNSSGLANAVSIGIVAAGVILT